MLFTSETARLAGKKGGRTTKKRHGLKFYSKNGKKGTRIQKQNKSRVKEGR